MFAKFKRNVYNFMRGRYGLDTLGNYMLWFGMALIVLNLFLKNVILEIIIFALLVYAYIRILSRNYEKRSRENEWFLDHTQGVRDRVETSLRRTSAHARIRKTHRIYTCPGCRQKIKVPKGKGKIVITCPKCRVEFTRKS